MPGPSGGLDRWVIHPGFEGIEGQSSKAAHLATSPLPASETAATLTGVYQIGVRQYKKPQQVATEVSTRRGFRVGTIPNLIEPSNQNRE